MQIYDPIHGTVDFSALSTDLAGSIFHQLLALPVIQRLRFIKQNNFASYRFLGADHTRYAHALGTAEVARRLISRLRAERIWDGFDYKEFSDNYPQAFSAASLSPPEVLATHVLAAALLQDIGELPYQFVTKKFFKLNRDALRTLSGQIDINLLRTSPKLFFGLAALFSSAGFDKVVGLDWTLLAHLIAGKSIIDSKKAKCLSRVVPLLDGEVDADRLDYVYRDAYHTVGYKGSPESVIRSLLYFDEKGPLFSEPGPVTEFFTLRGHLWSHVYLNPRVRLRIALLHEVFKAIYAQTEPTKNRAAYDVLKERNISFHLNVPQFIGLHDQTLWGALEEIYSTTTARQSLSSRGQKALELLLNHGDEYQSQWIKGPDKPISLKASIQLPDNFLYDTHQELFDHKLYSVGSVRIKGIDWEQLGNDGVIELERCGGPFDGFFREGAQGHPMPGAVQIFMPPAGERRGAAWDNVQKAAATRELYHLLMNRSKGTEFEIPVDTWAENGFDGKRIFVSFRWANVNHVDEVLRCLHDKKRRYKAWRGAYDGVGQTTFQNSIDIVEKSEAAVILVSREYVEAYRDLPDENIHAEISTIIDRVKSGNYPVVFVSMDSWETLKGKLPYKRMGFDAIPFVGNPVRNASPKEIYLAVEAALKRIGGDAVQS